eukprot:COSAG05_NODE_9496_length_620_cov_1.449136_1_plen_119_part_01
MVHRGRSARRAGHLFRVAFVLLCARIRVVASGDARRRAVLLAEQAQVAREPALRTAIVVVGYVDGQDDDGSGNLREFSATLYTGRWNGRIAGLRAGCSLVAAGSVPAVEDIRSLIGKSA